MIKKNISKAIKNQNWLAIEYNNKDNNVTHYWIAIKDLNYNNKSFSVSAFNMTKRTETNNGVIDIEIFFDRISKANIVRNTRYENDIDLSLVIESNEVYSKWLSFDTYRESTLDYIHECMINEETPYQSETTLIRGIDQDILDSFKVKDKIFLSYEQVSDLVPKLEVLIKQEERSHYFTVTLALNLLSINTKKGNYVVAYKEVYFNPLDKSLTLSTEVNFNYTFAANDKFTYQHNLKNYLDIETDNFISLFINDIKEAKELLEREVIKHGETLDDKPYIMDLNRMFNKHIEIELDTIKLRKRRDTLPTSIKAFFGNINSKLLGGNIRGVDVVLLDNKVNIDQLRVIYNSLIKPITYVQGPPGTGKTQTIINALISSFFNDDKVLVTSNNNKPINDIFKKLKAIKNKGMDITLPFIRLGNNEELKKTLKDIKYTLEKVRNNKIIDDRLDLHRRSSKEDMKIVNTLLYHYEKHTEINEELEVLRNLKTNISDSLRSLSLDELIKQKEVELSKYVKKEDSEVIKHIKKVDTKFLTWLSFTGIKHYQKILEPKNEVLYNILNIIDEDDKVKEFNKYIKEDENFNNFQKIFPIILTTNQSVHKLGSQKESFDLCIIDEAGQSSIGYSLFALARSKRLLLVGDQNQLKPVIGIPMETNDYLMNKYHVPSSYNYLENSILLTMQKVDTLSKFVLLSYHYRSHKDIINFSNNKYYNGQLKMPLKDTFKDNALEHINVDTSSEVSQLEKNTSLKEIDAIIRDIKEKGYTNVGVITPFRNQANLLQDSLVSNNLGNIAVGTVHTFQGDEKEVIYFSSGITSKSHEKSFDWVKNNQELINVATTRAKNKFILVSDANEVKSRSMDNNDFFELHKYVIKNGKEVELTESNQTYFINGANFKNYDTKKEAEFFETINHLLTTADRYELGSKVRIASIFTNSKDATEYDYSLKAEFDLVIFKKIGKSKIPIVVIELDGNEHYTDDKVITRDKIKESICKKNGIELIRINNRYSRRYLYIKDLLAHILY